MKKRIFLLSALLIFSASVKPVHFCSADENEDSDIKGEIESAIGEMESWANEKITFYAGRITGLKTNLEKLHKEQRKIIEDDSSKRQEIKEAQE